MKKLTFEYVRNYFKEQGCELLEKEYINNCTNMEYRCSCENINKIRFNHFKRGKRCKKCGKNEEHTLKYVQNYFKEQGCELLETEYINCKTKMKYKCSCGDISNISFNNFRKGHRCYKCGLNKNSIKQKHSFEFVKNYFKEQGCKLLEEEYNGCQIKMKYICECKNISKISFHNLKAGQRCMKCSNCGYSKESQKLFNAIYEKINKKYKHKTYYATLNNEFGICYKGKNYKYDYVNSKFKKVIEYNGSVWHPSSNLKDKDTGWHAIDKNKTAKEARDYEKIKYEGLEKRSYKILTVWDYEMKKDFDSTVQKCLNFLTV